MYCNAGTDSLPSGGIFAINNLLRADTVGRVEADVEPQSKEVTREPPELVQHFRL
jgi:hypothetical protein